MALVLPLELHLVFHVFHPLRPARDFNGFLHHEYRAYCAFQPDRALVGFDANPFVPERRFPAPCVRIDVVLSDLLSKVQGAE